MGWQDRDYASPRGYAYGRVGGSRGGLLGGRSIVTVLIGINAVVYVLGAMSPAVDRWLTGYETISPMGVLTLHFGVAELRAVSVLHGQVWRLITAQYLHAGTWHLLFNMIALHFLGRPLERMWSPRKFFTIYTVSGLAGNVFYTVLGATEVIHPVTAAIGASGCIYGLLGIVAVLFPTATVYVYMLFPIRIRTAAMIFGGIAFFTVLQRGENYGGEACHLAGLVFGVWWAVKGDRWWALQGRDLWARYRPGSGRRAVGRGSVASPGGFVASVTQHRADAATIDRILRKVHDGGIHTLTDAEKCALRDATDRERRRNAGADRVDRL